MSNRFALRHTSAAVALVFAAGSAAAADENFKIAFIDSLSGPFAAIGSIMLDHIQFSTEEINAAGGVLKGTKLQVLQFDSKVSVPESQSAMQSAIDQGAKVIISGGSGSAVIAALVDTANKYNQRNPDKPVIVMNYSSVDPDLTGKRCSFWYFQVEANTAMKMKALANFIQKTPDIKKMYLLNQDYAHGRQWAYYGKEFIAKARPDIQFVGEEYHALGRIKDFAPYAQKIKAAEADSVITGNWGPDLSLLYRSAADAGMNLRYFNHTAGAQPGMVTTASIAKLGQLTYVAEWHPGEAGVPKVDAMAQAFKAKTGKDFIAPRFDLVPRALAAAINKAQSLDTTKIALAMEGLKLDTPIGPVRMRAEDHQMLIPQVVNTIAPVDGKTVKVGVEGTQWGFRTEAVYSGEDLALPVTECRMDRP